MDIVLNHKGHASTVPARIIFQIGDAFLTLSDDEAAALMAGRQFTTVLDNNLDPDRLAALFNPLAPQLT